MRIGEKNIEGQIKYKYRNELKQVGFTDSDEPGKLPYLDIAFDALEAGDVSRIMLQYKCKNSSGCLFSDANSQFSLCIYMPCPWTGCKRNGNYGIILRENGGGYVFNKRGKKNEF